MRRHSRDIPFPVLLTPDKVQKQAQSSAVERVEGDREAVIPRDTRTMGRCLPQQWQKVGRVAGDTLIEGWLSLKRCALNSLIHQWGILWAALGFCPSCPTWRSKQSYLNQTSTGNPQNPFTKWLCEAKSNCFMNDKVCFVQISACDLKHNLDVRTTVDSVINIIQ